MTFITYYFSGTGNTRWAVEKFTSLAEAAGHKAEMISIEENSKNNVHSIIKRMNAADYIGIAYPVYGADMPAVMKRFLAGIAEVIKHIDEIKGKPVYVITTAGFINGFGPIEASKALKRLGLELKGHIFLRIANNSSTPLLKTNPVSENEMERRKSNAVSELQKLLNRLADGKKYIRGIGPYLIPGIIIRKTTAKSKDNFYKRQKVDLSLCSLCMICLNNCPTGCIEYNGKDFIFKPDCTSCFRCYNFCPKAAILYNGRYADPSIYARYLGPEKGYNI